MFIKWKKITPIRYKFYSEDTTTKEEMNFEGDLKLKKRFKEEDIIYRLTLPWDRKKELRYESGQPIFLSNSNIIDFFPIRHKK